MTFAKAGEPVTDADGNVICYIKNELQVGKVSRASDFHEFTEGNQQWVEGQQFDRRCMREADGHTQIRINGEWRP